MILTFDGPEVARLIRHSLASPNFWHSYTQLNEPGLILVADHGVYLMSNGDPKITAPGHTEQNPQLLVAYAKEANPNTLDFDTWWNVRGAVFGGDDGAETFPIGSMTRNLQTSLARVERPGSEFRLTLRSDAVEFEW